MDAHMWTMILPLFSDAAPINGFSVAAAHQLQALEEKGTEHGRHFDFKPLLDAYAIYRKNPVQDTWCRGVGGAQRLLPDHVVQEYTTPDRPLHPTPSFAVADARRPTCNRDRGVNWWRAPMGSREAALWLAQIYYWPHNPPSTPRTGSVLGTGWAVSRGNRPMCDALVMCFCNGHMPTNHADCYFGDGLPRGWVRSDQHAIETLCRQRCDELTDLLSRYGVKPTPVAETKSPGPGR